MARILIADGSELKVTIQWEPLDKLLMEKLDRLGHEVTLEHYEPEVLKDKIKDFDAIVIGNTTIIDAGLIDAAAETGKLKIIVKAGISLSNVDVAYAQRKGIAVENTPECSRNAIAELIIGHMVSISRFLFGAFITMKNGQWEQPSYTGIEMANRTLGLVGLDETAKILARKAMALGLKVQYFDERGPVEGYDDYQYMSFEEVLKNSTYLSLHVPYDPEKGYLLTEKELMSMEKGASLINTSDGRLVDEQALLKALGASMAELHLFGACLDVYEQEPTTNQELLAHARVSLTPHIGQETYESNTQRIEEVVEIIQTHLVIA